MWLLLRNMPHEHLDQASNIAQALGDIIGMETSNEETKDPKFCINLHVSKGWARSIVLESDKGILPNPPPKLLS